MNTKLKLICNKYSLSKLKQGILWIGFQSLYFKWAAVNRIDIKQESTTSRKY